MEPGAVYSCHSDMAMIVTYDGMYSVRIIIFWCNKLWGIRSGGKCTNGVSSGNRNGICNRIRGIPGYFVWTGTIINANMRDIQSWANTIN